MSAGKKDCFVAIYPTGGEYAGADGSIQAAEFYGPYTFDQAREIVGECNRFPLETYRAAVVRPEKLPLKELRFQVRDKIEQALDEESADNYRAEAEELRESGVLIERGE